MYLLTEGLNIGACFGEATLFMTILFKDAFSLIKQFGSTGGGGDKVLGELVIPGFLKGKEMSKYIPFKAFKLQKTKMFIINTTFFFFFTFPTHFSTFKSFSSTYLPTIIGKKGALPLLFSSSEITDSSAKQIRWPYFKKIVLFVITSPHLESLLIGMKNLSQICTYLICMVHIHFYFPIQAINFNFTF